eukprot:123645_1
MGCTSSSCSVTKVQDNNKSRRLQNNIIRCGLSRNTDPQPHIEKSKSIETDKSLPPTLSIDNNVTNFSTESNWSSCKNSEIDENETNSLRNDEKNITYDRVESFKAITDKQSIKEKMSSIYDYIDESDESEDDENEISSCSPLSAAEINEIKRRKSESSHSKLNDAHLLRNGTLSCWDDVKLKQLEFEMKNEIDFIKNNNDDEGKQNNNKENNELNLKLDQNNINNQQQQRPRRGSQLFRYKSVSKWNDDEIQTENEEMRKLMVHLIESQLPQNATHTTMTTADTNQET